MARIEAAGVPIRFEEEYADSAEAMAGAIDRTAGILRDNWRLDIPNGCVAHVMTDWWRFTFDTCPPLWRPFVFVGAPLWAWRARRTFRFAGGWLMPWKGRPAIGVKPRQLLEVADTSYGERLFVKTADSFEKVRRITAHEFTHACTAHLRLPSWLNEGLAMRAVDHMTGTDTVLEATRELAEPMNIDSNAYREGRVDDIEAILRLYATGYWMTRRLESASPSTLSELLERRRPFVETNRMALAALGQAGCGC